jgi:acetolactate synthase I/II/III large subunit
MRATGIPSSRTAIIALMSTPCSQPGESYHVVMEGQPSCVLLISCASPDSGGGLFAFNGISLETVDRMGSAGLFLHGEQVLRLLFTNAAPDFGAEILFYDEAGVRKYLRVDGACNPHYVDWDGENYVLLSTWTNGVVWVSPEGEIKRRWQLPGENDSWHLNCVFVKDGELYLTAFGDLRRHREHIANQRKPQGMLLKHSTGERVVTGLACPHSPRYFDGAWAVCSSSLNELVHIEEGTGRVRHRVALDGWTRGLAITDDYIFVGESRTRHRTAANTSSSVAVLQRSTWTLLGRIPVPSGEISDLLVVPARLLKGLRRGFRTNPQRVLEQDQYSMFQQIGISPARIWAIGDPLEPRSCHVRVESEVPATMAVGATIECDCRVTNLGDTFLVGVPPNPVNISYRWLDSKSRAPIAGVEGLRSRLTFSLPPREAQAYKFMVRAPMLPGSYTLAVTLVQEQVAWFDDISSSNACLHEVSVESVA